MCYLRLLAIGSVSLLMVAACGMSEDAVEVAIDRAERANGLLVQLLLRSGPAIQ